MKYRRTIMKCTLLITLLLFLVIIASCTGTEQFTKEELEQIVCTADVEECSDGSFVGRNPWNNCAFDKCP